MAPRRCSKNKIASLGKVVINLLLNKYIGFVLAKISFLAQCGVWPTGFLLSLELAVDNFVLQDNAAEANKDARYHQLPSEFTQYYQPNGECTHLMVSLLSITDIMVNVLTITNLTVRVLTLQ